MGSDPSCLTLSHPVGYHRPRPVLVVRNAMTPRLMKQSLALFLVLCLLAVGGLASAQSISHESHHAHHHKAAHTAPCFATGCAPPDRSSIR